MSPVALFGIINGSYCTIQLDFNFFFPTLSTMVLKTRLGTKLDLPSVLDFYRFFLVFPGFYLVLGLFSNQTSFWFPVQPIEPAGLDQFLKPYFQQKIFSFN